MNFLTVTSDARLSLRLGDRMMISPSPIAVLYDTEDTAYLPINADWGDEQTLRVHYTLCDIVFVIQKREGYYRLIAETVPACVQTLIFGPYMTDGTEAGEILGASWHQDGSVVCIQSLCPKVEGGIKRASKNGASFSPCSAAALCDGHVTLQCSVSDHSRPVEVDYTGLIPGYNGTAVSVVQPIPGEDAYIRGASVALLAAESSEALLSIIDGMEAAEGLPRPTFRGQYAKRDRYATSIYMIFAGTGLSSERRIELAVRAGVSCVYLSDLLGTWGHFTPNTDAYPGGASEILSLSEQANAHGLTIGTHSLSNFITTNDAYVSPIPDRRLLVMDRTTLAETVDAEQTTLPLTSPTNYAIKSALCALRIGNELITYTDFDSASNTLVGCIRGAFGTYASEHHAGEEVCRLWDHGYRTLFPDLSLQGEMADRLADALTRMGITRLSFDGLEGCLYPGVGEYGMAEFVRRVFATVGNELICDASIPLHYLWHAFTYFNWGEPWYDSERRGGMYADRVDHQRFFARNLIPAMMGWYSIFDARGRFEATSPETMEYMLSRSVAFDAGLAIRVRAEVARNHGRIEEYMDMIRSWIDFRLYADIPQTLRERMQDETSNWHLSKMDDCWCLEELLLRRQDILYTDRAVETETGLLVKTGDVADAEVRRYHTCRLILDRSIDGAPEPLRFRIRVGIPEHGLMENLELIYDDPCVRNEDGSTCTSKKFSFVAQGGDYLEYTEAGELRHYDKNYQLLQVHPLEGNPIVLQERKSIQLRFATNSDDTAVYLFTEIRRKGKYDVRVKSKPLI